MAGNNCQRTVRIVARDLTVCCVAASRVRQLSVRFKCIWNMRRIIRMILLKSSQISMKATSPVFGTSIRVPELLDPTHL